MLYNAGDRSRARCRLEMVPSTFVDDSSQLAANRHLGGSGNKFQEDRLLRFHQGARITLYLGSELRFRILMDRSMLSFLLGIA